MFVFFLSVYGFTFERAFQKPRGLLILKIAHLLNGTLQLGVLSLKPEVTFLNQSLGWLILAFSIAIFWWARSVTRGTPLSLSYHSDLPKHLNKKGPYKLIRHPFYLSYLFCYLACAVYSSSRYSFAGFALMAILYYKAARYEEKKFFASSQKDEYQKYMGEAGMFWPKY